MAKYAYMGEKMWLLHVLFILLIYYKIIKHPKFNNEMHSAENWVLNPVILHYWHNLPHFDNVQCFVTICIVKSAI